MKRIIDLLLALPAVALLSPLLIMIAAVIRITIGSPVLFIQRRPGLNGKPFKIFKFRTMTNAKNEFGDLLPDSQRMTQFGELLRTTSLDELPELFNILKGNMSIVGPRPLLMQYLDRYTPEQTRRHEVKPGLTGWAQINGRNAISWEDKFELDVWYVDHRSLNLDLKIIWTTITKVLKREGISEAGHATMTEFMGSKEV